MLILVDHFAGLKGFVLCWGVCETFWITLGEGFFYLLDYVTSTENFQIGDRKKERKLRDPYLS